MTAVVHDFQHAALLHDGPEGFAAAASGFVRDGLDGDEAVIVVASPPNTAALRAELGTAADGIVWGAADDWYLRPGLMFERFLETLSALAVERPGRMRVVGEQVHAGRPDGERRELLRYDALSNLAFRPSGAWVLCPYDRRSTSPSVLDAVRRAHPFLWEERGVATSADYVAPELSLAMGDADLDLPAAPAYATVLASPFDPAEVRSRTAAISRGFLPADRVEDLVFAVNEVINNAETHGDGCTAVALWLDGARLTCEVRDAGPGLPHPFCGYLRPDERSVSGRGLWLARQLCDLVEVRSAGHGTTVRVHVA
jgi:anti-sigma regulatory factor (Ser/Thr protein kinase)